MNRYASEVGAIIKLEEMPGLIANDKLDSVEAEKRVMYSDCTVSPPDR